MALVTLIRPRVLVAVSSPVSPTCPPIGLAYVASSLLSDNHRVKVIDAVGEAPSQFLNSDYPAFKLQGLSVEEIFERIDKNTDIVGITCMYSYEWLHIRKFINY